MHTNFSHGGTLGDVFYSLNFLYDYCEQFGLNKINLHLQRGVPTRANLKGHPGAGVQLSAKMIEMSFPLLRNVPIINKLTTDNKLPAGYINLEKFRDMNFSLGKFDIKAYYYGIMPYPVKRNLGRKVLSSFHDKRAEGKIIVFRSQRYNIPMDYKVLEKVKDRVILLGVPTEISAFHIQSFKCKNIEIKDFQEAANLIGSADFVVGNQTGLFSLAEQLKVPRVLESWQQGPNVVCDGGLCYEGINPEHFNDGVNQMIKRFYG